MRIDRIPDFITEQERLEILDWIESNVELFGPTINRDSTSYNLRSSTRRMDNVEFPDIVHKVFSRLQETYDFTDNCYPEISPTSEGLISVITYPGGDTFSHKDTSKNCGEDRAVIRFNILIQKPEIGGILWVKDNNGTIEEVDTKERELHAYNVSDNYHGVTEVGGDIPRYILLMSMCCPAKEWENYIKRN